MTALFYFCLILGIVLISLSINVIFYKMINGSNQTEAMVALNLNDFDEISSFSFDNVIDTFRDKGRATHRKLHSTGMMLFEIDKLRTRVSKIEFKLFQVRTIIGTTVAVCGFIAAIISIFDIS